MNALNMLVIGITTTVGAAGAGLLAQNGEITQRRAVDRGAIWHAVWAESLSGIVGSVDLENNTFSLTTEDGASHAIRVNEDTAYTIDGEDSTAEEVLEVGAQVSATVDDNLVATGVDRASD
ncbi:MAG: hypothetical protein DHS20C14_19200 [Phycisphaeraceae bacterium]|nr:MAG: hypothetical protein DHS20C14_19170 [Phycisphaeraceae bacterium]GJM19707.1 MAG: hypothetical protein DHS20C14_19200 [Phycisphaeraceae bacterium]